MNDDEAEKSYKNGLLTRIEKYDTYQVEIEYYDNKSMKKVEFCYVDIKCDENGAWKEFYPKWTVEFFETGELLSYRKYYNETTFTITYYKKDGKELNKFDMDEDSCT